MVEVTCPDCGATCTPEEIERLDEDPPITVARRQQGFSGTITSLLEMESFAYVAELPCGCKILTVK